MLPVVTAAEMRALDRSTMEEIGLSGFTLMETAGRAVADAAMLMRRPDAGGHVAVVCGPGNNGGDGFVVARVLRARGVDAIAYLAVPREAMRGHAADHLTVLEKSGGVLLSIATPAELERHKEAIASAEVAVDALFGIGLVRPVEGHFAEVVAAINAARRRLAVDIPSGLDSDTGRTLGVAVDAHRTVTMGPLKVALAGAPGFARCGEVIACDIGIPPALVASTARAHLLEPHDLAARMPQAAALDHKGRRGHVVVIGGAPEMRGAGRLASVAALRAGAGLVTLAGDGEVTAPDAVMTRSIGADTNALAAFLEGKAAVVIGPGLGTSEAAAARVATVLAAGVPAVLDADALNLMHGDASRIAGAAGPIVITPHPGEAARLLGTTVAGIEDDRLAAARMLAQRTHAVVVLKGARTVICDGTLGDEHCSINPSGGPALATGGSGDVLAGTVAAFLAQGVAAADAACLAVYAHGRAGEQLATVHGARGVLASDLPEAIAGAIRTLTSSTPFPP
jgi:NAD(P)H-hydrate epimerase